MDNMGIILIVWYFASMFGLTYLVWCKMLDRQELRTLKSAINFRIDALSFHLKSDNGRLSASTRSYFILERDTLVILLGEDERALSKEDRKCCLEIMQRSE